MKDRIVFLVSSILSTALSWAAFISLKGVLEPTGQTDSVPVAILRGLSIVKDAEDQTIALPLIVSACVFGAVLAFLAVLYHRYGVDAEVYGYGTITALIALAFSFLTIITQTWMHYLLAPLMVFSAVVAGAFYEDRSGVGHEGLIVASFEALIVMSMYLKDSRPIWPGLAFFILIILSLALYHVKRHPKPAAF